jgi:hypothetical protein
MNIRSIYMLMALLLSASCQQEKVTAPVLPESGVPTNAHTLYISPDDSEQNNVTRRIHPGR